MATQQEIAQKQAEWEALSEQYQEKLDMAVRCRESDMMDMAETYDEQADNLDHSLFDLENWLVNNDAPGWVST